MAVLSEVTRIDLDPFRAKKNDVSDLPELYSLERIEDKALWVLAFAKDKVGQQYLAAEEVSTVLADVFEVSADEAAIRMALSRAGTNVHAMTQGRSKKFSIMKDGREALALATKDRVILVDPASPHSSIRRIADLLGALTGTVKICDPWVDRKTLEVLSMIPPSTVVHLLSTEPKERSAFTRFYKMFRIDRPLVELRTIPGGTIHDRYIISGSMMWLVGHSLNAIGTKQSFVVEVGGQAQNLVTGWFDTAWTTATVFG